MSNSILQDATRHMLELSEHIKLGGGERGIERQHLHSRLTARERIELLKDKSTPDFECGLFIAHEMYMEFGGAPSAGVITTIAQVGGKYCMLIANDATVKAGAFFPMTCKKIIRAQTIAERARLPLIYLVDSAGVFLPLQEDVFPDTDDFGRIFRNNAVFSAKGISQIAAIMGNCVAGGGYLPVLCDTLLMTEGSGLYLAGPALVKAAIGQEVENEELGGAEMHAEISGTIDFLEPDDETCIKQIQSLMHSNMSVLPVAEPPYVSHCFRVAMTVNLIFGFDDVDVLAGALLHDTIEDCDVDYDEILECFGRNVADYVAVMTKDMRLEETIREVSYDKQLEEGPWQGRLIKLADVYDNFTDSPPKKRAQYIERVNRILALTKHDEQLQEAREHLQNLMQELAQC